MTAQDFMRATALALRDLAESQGAIEAQFTFDDGSTLTWGTDDGFHLLTAAGETHDLTEWVDRVDFVPVDGVVSVREQPVLMAAMAR